MADIAIYRINYKSDFILTLNSDVGWATPFCIKFWTGAPSKAYFVGFDGTNFCNCRMGDAADKLVVLFDDHHLPLGTLKMQIAYHTTVEEFPHQVFDEVTNAHEVVIDIDGTDYQVLFDLTGEVAPEIEFSLPAYFNEAQRIQNELQRQQAEAQRIENEESRVEAEQGRVNAENNRVTEFARLKRESEAATHDANVAAAGAERVNAQLNGYDLTVTDRNGDSETVYTKGVSIVSFVKTGETFTDTVYIINYSDGSTQLVEIPKGEKGDPGQIQSDWNQTNIYALDYIRNKPDNFAFLGDSIGSATTTDFDPQTDTVWHIPQSLGFAAKLQARSNIGAQGALTAGSGITLFNDTISTEYTILPISQSDYDSLQTKDSHTLYIITA
jgi:hypothetical protein